MHDGSEIDAVVRSLGRYLRDNPAACDSAEGIRRWWFADGHVVAEDELDKALNRMKQRGLIEETIAVDGRVRYRRIASDEQLAAVVWQTGDGASP